MGLGAAAWSRRCQRSLIKLGALTPGPGNVMLFLCCCCCCLCLQGIVDAKSTSSVQVIMQVRAALAATDTHRVPRRVSPLGARAARVADACGGPCRTLRKHRHRRRCRQTLRPARTSSWCRSRASAQERWVGAAMRAGLSRPTPHSARDDGASGQLNEVAAAAVWAAAQQPFASNCRCRHTRRTHPLSTCVYVLPCCVSQDLTQDTFKAGSGVKVCVGVCLVTRCRQGSVGRHRVRMVQANSDSRHHAAPRPA